MPSATRITHVIVRLGTGGAEKSLYRLLRHTRGEFEHEVICFGRPTEIGRDIEALGVAVHWLDERRAGPWVWVQARRILAARPPQILQGWMYYGNLLASLLGRRLRSSTRVIWNVRAAPFDLQQEKPTTRFSMRLAARWLPHHIIYNADAGVAAHEQLGYNKSPHTVIHNGIDLQAFAPRPDARGMVRNTYGIGAEPWVAMVCRYHVLKGVGDFLAAVHMLRARGCAAAFALAGAGMQPDNAALMHLLAEHGLSDQDIALLGEVSTPEDFLPALDVLVQASLREGTPNILLEAMACGVATVATDVGDSARIVRHAERLVTPGDVSALAAAIAYAADADRDEDARRRRIQAERAHLQAEYETEVCMQAYRDTYTQVLSAAA